MPISFYKGLTRNPKMGNNPIWVFPNIWKLRQVRNKKFGTNVSYKILLDAAKYQSYSFYRFWVIKGKPTRGEGIKRRFAYFEMFVWIFTKSIFITWTVWVKAALVKVLSIFLGCSLAKLYLHPEMHLWDLAIHLVLVPLWRAQFHWGEKLNPNSPVQKFVKYSIHQGN